MKLESLKLLLIASEGRLAQIVSDMLREGGKRINEIVTLPTVDAALAALETNPFHAVLFELSLVNTAGLFQVTLLSTKVPRVPVIVLGPIDDETFAVEIVRAGAQDYLAKDHLDSRSVRHAIRCAVERQRECVALIDEKESYHAIFDHLVEGIYRTTPDGRFLLVNQALARICGYESPMALMASTKDIAWRLYVEPGRRDEFIRLMQERNTLVGFESEVRRRDGTVIWVSENCRAVRDNQGRVLYYEGTVKDITERKRSG
jgi:PAS domain S-box-containing protein